MSTDLRRHNTFITNSPQEIQLPDYSQLHANLQPPHSERLASFETALAQLCLPDHIGDKEILQVARENVDSYQHIFGENYAQAKALLKAGERYIPIEAKNTETVGSEHQDKDESWTAQSDSVLYDEFKQAYEDECRALGMSQDARAEHRHVVNTAYSEFLRSTIADIDGRQARFTTLTSHFGTPDVLRAEAITVGIESLKNLTSKLEALGPRPQKSLWGVLGSLGSRHIHLRPEQFDDLVEERMKRYAAQPMTELLQAYTQMATVHYAKIAFGSTPVRFDRGENISPDLRDLYQHRHNSICIGRSCPPSWYNKPGKTV